MNKSMLGLLAITILSGIVLMSNATSATKSVSNASVTVPEACTMTGSGMNSHTATITPGTFSASSGSDYENGIGKTTFTVVCNDYNGFSIYAIGYTGDSYDDTNHTKLVGANTNVAIDTAVYNSGDTTSSWSMKVNKVTDSTISYLPANMSIQNSFDSWHTIPDTYTKVAQYKASTGSSTTDTTLGAKIDTTYAAFIAPNQPGDTYIGQVKYTMVHPYNETVPQQQNCPSGKICYYANAGTSEGTMGNQSVSTSATATTLLASNYSRTGYGFAGWSDKYDYATNPEARFYGPQENITFTAGQYTGSNPGLPLYAVWVKTAGSLQDSTKVSQLCGTSGSLITAPTDGTADLASVSALTDIRDNQTYAIAKLADSKCWMIENLRLENTAEHNSDGILAQSYGTSVTYGNFSGLADAESTTFQNARAANSLYYNGIQEGTASIDIGTTDNPYYRMPRYNNWNNQSIPTNRPQIPTSNSATNSVTNAGLYSYGNYYTWHAAIADTTYYTSGDHNTTSICPSGWQIPLGNTSSGDITQGETDIANRVGGFSYLDRKMGGPGNNQNTSTGSQRWRKFPANFLYAGWFDATSANYRGSSGFYWSSSANTSTYAYYLYLSGSNVYPSTSGYYKFTGFSIRCTVSAGA